MRVKGLESLNEFLPEMKCELVFSQKRLQVGLRVSGKGEADADAEGEGVAEAEGEAQGRGWA